MTAAPQFVAVGPPWWDDAPVFIVGVGPSLIDVDLNRLAGLGHVLAVKESVWDMPFADAAIGLDLGWAKRRGAELAAQPVPVWFVTDNIDSPLMRPEFSIVCHEGGRGLSLDPSRIRGSDSGFAAFNLAVLKRARDIVLIGMDYGGTPYCPDRYTHKPESHNARYMPRWAREFDHCARDVDRLGIRVRNASPISAITAFDRVDLGTLFH